MSTNDGRLIMFTVDFTVDAIEYIIVCYVCNYWE